MIIDVRLQDSHLLYYGLCAIAKSFALMIITVISLVIVSKRKAPTSDMTPESYLSNFRGSETKVMSTLFNSLTLNHLICFLRNGDHPSSPHR